VTYTFFGLNIALSALQAQQTALNVTAHNVANANTDGYTRQDAQMVAASPFPVPIASVAGQAGQLGTGVDISMIRRLRDSFLDSQLRTQMGSQGYWNTKQDYLQQIETVFNEPSDQGINSLLTKFWSAWQDLAADPSNYAARVTVVESGSVLADVIRSDYQQLSSLRTQADNEISSDAGQINSWLAEIASLNKQISAVEVQQSSSYDPNVKVAQDQANDLRDRRDLLLDQLSQMIKVNYREESDGTVTVWLGDISSADPLQQQVLVQAGSHNYLLRGPDTTSTDPVTGATVTTLGRLVWSDDNDPTTTTNQTDAIVNDGELKGLLETRDVTLDPTGGGSSDPSQSLAWRLDQMAQALITLVNGAHEQGYDLNGNPGEAFFVSNDSNPIGAANISVNTDLLANANLVAAASAWGTTGQVGNGEQAAVIANAIQTGKAGAVTTNVTDWYNALISKLGVDSQEAQDMATNQQALVDRLTNNRESFSGVSLDEEATNVIRFQHAYEAAARVMNAMDEMLDKLVNGTGVVGR
jgi:flagellar hook-associated protein 1 FlgK